MKAGHGHSVGGQHRLLPPWTNNRAVGGATYVILSLLISGSAYGHHQDYLYSRPTVSGDANRGRVSPETNQPESLQHVSTVMTDSRSYSSADPPLSLRRGDFWSPSQQFRTRPAKRLDKLTKSSASSTNAGGGDASGKQRNNDSQSAHGGQQSSQGISATGSQATGKSFIVMDPTNLIEFDLQVNIPFSFDYSFLGLGRRRKRDVSAGDDSDDEQVLGDAVNELLELNLARLRSVFMGLGVHEPDCLEEVICVIHRRPADYHPLPALINRVLRHDDLKADYEMHLSSMNSSSALDYSRYVGAIRRGAGHPTQPCSSCQSGATRCSTAVDSILERPTFKFLHYVNTFARSMRMT